LNELSEKNDSADGVGLVAGCGVDVFAGERDALGQAEIQTVGNRIVAFEQIAVRRFKRFYRFEPT
jgi:hypothetical protein